MNKFVVFTVPRTGSTLLIKTLDTHPEIFCAGELFFFSGKTYHTECQYRFWRLKFLNSKLHYLLNYPKLLLTLSTFMNRFFTVKENNIKAKGFKLMYYQTLYTPGIIKYLKHQNVRVILLQRENILRNALSDIRARSTGIYHNTGDDEMNNLPKLDVDIEILKNKMGQIERTQKLIEKTVNGMQVMKLSYEELNVNWNEAMKKVLNFLQVKEMPLPAPVKKLNPERLEEMVENYGDVKEWLKENKYENFIQ